MITGGAGFMGFHLAKFLVSRGDRVILVDNFARAVKDPDLAELAQNDHCDLLTLDLESQPLPTISVDAVVHLAAVVGVRNVTRNPYEVLRRNQAILERVIAYSKRLPSLRNFIFASTSEVYADAVTMGKVVVPTPEHVALVVQEPSNPRGTYALSKIYGEAMCQTSGLPVTVVRPHNIYGPRMGLSHVVPELMQRCWMSPKAVPLDVASAGHTRTFCYVTDACNYLAKLIDREGTGLVLNLGRQEPEVTILDLAQTIMKSLKVTRPVRVVADTPGSPARRAPDTQALLEVTGIYPLVDLSQGLSHTFDWYRTNVFSGMTKSAQ